MDVHGVPKLGGAGAIGHHVEDRVNSLVAARAKDRAAKNGIALRVNHDFHEADLLVLLDSTADVGHRPAADLDRGGRRRAPDRR